MVRVENFNKFSDLPPLGWDVKDDKFFYCPYVQPWLEKGTEDLGLFYCEVDFAKYEGYNPALRVERLKSILEGHDYCELRIE